MSRHLRQEVTMDVAIKLNPAERIRRAKAADPSLTQSQICRRLDVTPSQVKAALAYNPEVKMLRRRA